ncbi:MAG TPA: 4-(cytidine 5'-diphospho)-2-C-methyl-D-erythritol kinase, partial [Bacillota bacterium]|nr:4-(cytidine 5'-diphospho)-2-C-methyl-D-erythritol kinase [Bacillota bacterium]
MGSIRLRTPGKINWTLEVIGRRRDGYHDVRMLMQSVSLFDQITLSDRASGITVVSDSKDIPLGEGNIAYRAADLIKRYSKRESGVE